VSPAAGPPDAAPDERRYAAWLAHVSGRVQGVYYRAHTAEHARELGLRGYARNLPDGRVEVLAGGDPRALEQLLQILRRGPPLAHVTQVIVTEQHAHVLDGIDGFARE